MVSSNSEISKQKNEQEALTDKEQALKQRLEALASEEAAVRSELLKVQQALNKASTGPKNASELTLSEKVNIFMRLFQGRKDVFPKRWYNSKKGKSGYSPACSNDWVHNICGKYKKIKCTECKNQAFIPVTESIIRNHLRGECHGGEQKEYTIGVYPLLRDDSCWFLAVDFDKANWMQDAEAFIQVCQDNNVPASLERSRSGQGGHVWIFFDEAIPAVIARKMGSALLTEAMERHPTIGFESYDRFFPNQDVLPLGGFGNLIALPLQMDPRSQGNSVFLDEHFRPYEDQWAYLNSITRVPAAAVHQLVDKAALKGKIMGVRLPVQDEHACPWEIKSSPEAPDFKIKESVLQPLTLIYSNQIFIPRENLPASLINKLIRLAAFQNPAFYKAQSMRFSTANIPRIVACAEYFSAYIGLPRGCMEACLELLNSLEIKSIVDDKRNIGKPIKVKFLGHLTSMQKTAFKALLQHDNGVLSAGTAFGKTVIGANVIAKRKRNTLIVVHRQQLLEQWVERLKAFLGLSPNQVGTLGGGKRNLTGHIDVAMFQSLVKKNTVDSVVTEYGQLIIDECHHISASSFEAVTRTCNAKYVLGLTATALRKDGHHPIIFMQCGPVRYHVDAKKQAKIRSFTHKIKIRNTSFEFKATDPEKKTPINDIYAALSSDEKRNKMALAHLL